MVANKKNANAEVQTSSEPIKPAEPISFTKEQLIASDKFANQKDLVSALLEDGKTYTISETEKIINDHKKRKVK